MKNCIYCEQEGWRYDEFVDSKDKTIRAFICADCLKRLVNGYEVAEKMRESLEVKSK